MIDQDIQAAMTEWDTYIKENIQFLSEQERSCLTTLIIANGLVLSGHPAAQIDIEAARAHQRSFIAMLAELIKATEARAMSGREIREIMSDGN